MLSLREARAEDKDILYLWANDPVTRKNSFNQSAIPYEDHEKWFERVMKDCSVKLFILIYDTIPAGQVRLNLKNKTAEISYSIAPEFRRRGFGCAIIELTANLVKEKIPEITTLIAKVKPDNEPSIKVFEKLGFKANHISYSLDLSEED